jgi:hypothetical protein|tara:strand:+ start:574 stop:690 length:117 start_codon:yes stop_codon:yes gene_type:complete
MQGNLKKDQKTLRIEEALKSNLKKRKEYQSKIKKKNKK